ncbi:Phosphate--AMP phosphotransferase [Planctomycetales bacterium 10988]|nr:Phosphate--AMP phosphotransferase [Planctomycetales bacterium 10988]
MLETLDLQVKLAKSAYKARKKQLQIELARLQREAFNARLGIIVLIEGWELSGKALTIQFLNEFLDPRGFQVHAMYPPTQEERLHPFVRRYMLRMPAYGSTAFFQRSWYHLVLDAQVRGDGTFDPHTVYQEIRQYERMLTDDGYLIFKFWLHIDKKEQRKRRDDFDRMSFRRLIGPDDPEQHRYYDEYAQAAEEMFTATSTADSPWHLIPANDRRYARVAVANRLVQRIQMELHKRAQNAIAQEPLRPRPLPPLERPSVMDKVDLSVTMEKKEYKKRLKKAKKKVLDAQFQTYQHQRGVIFVFEGWDAGGKGGAIRRLTSHLDPRYFRVHPTAAPRGEEVDHHYLWRFWKEICPRGQWAIFDRSWYGRVLVERVEQFARQDEWERAYREINEFERSLYESGYLIFKYWIHISPEEQLKRFEERERVEYKRHKITEEDWRNRKKWLRYEEAADDMFRRTSTTIAPWHIIPGNDKPYARVKILENFIQGVNEGLQRPFITHKRAF